MARKRTKEQDIPSRIELYEDAKELAGVLDGLAEQLELDATSRYYLKEAACSLCGMSNLLKDVKHYANTRKRESKLNSPNCIPDYGIRFLGYAITTESHGQPEWVVCQRMMKGSDTATISHSLGDPEIVRLIGWKSLPN